MTVTQPVAEQAETAFELILAQQGDPATACAYVGSGREGLRAELEDLDTPWTDTLRVAVQDGAVVGAVLVDHDEETGRSWIHGPWAVDDGAWAAWARGLLDAAVAQTPDGVDDHEVSAAPANARLAALAADLGWHPSEVNIAYVARDVSGWPQASAAAAAGATVREAAEGDLPRVTELHEQAFPRTYATARQLLADAERVTLVLETPDGVVGYASAKIQADGTGYLDFIALAPEVRGRGLARPLLAETGRRVVERAPDGSVNLTVKEGNAPAVAMYESFGFVRDAELVGYRSRPYAG